MIPNAAGPLLRPGLKDFLRLSQEATLVPVVKSVTADLLTPVSAFLSLAAGEPCAFLLESVEGGERIGRYTFLGVRPYMVFEARAGKMAVRRGRKTERRTGNLFAVARELLRQHRVAPVADLPPFTAGAVGFIAYDAVRALESVPSRARDDLRLPDAMLMFFDRLLAFDHVRHQIYIVAAVDVRSQSERQLRGSYEQALRDLAGIEKHLARGAARQQPKPLRQPAPLRVGAATTRSQYLAGARRIQDYIAAGDVYQVVLSQRLDFALGGDAFAIYRSLRMLNPSPYMYYLRMGGLEVLGSSPEMLVKVNGRKLEYRPIAGTRPRGTDEAVDQQLEQELRGDEKERAEHVMLVDLGRNDLGRVSEYGSVAVRELMAVERYSHVMHLVSRLEGRLRPELDALDALAACFPAGTLTGAPKVRAMQIIEELEPVRRGIYGGAVLYADFAGNLDSCIAIRTMLVQSRRAYVQAGAGIVADSDPAREYDECRNKAAALIRAVQMARSSGVVGG
ncbi:MAG: anthranilate synthase component I [Acidobacteria bacterium]|nr:anthranilate synthase component I [Acidobacteriota bacterium]